MLPARRHEMSRLEGFSDAVFAFALTLLVVALDVPKNYDDLMRLMAGFLPFACCFSLLVWMWYAHNVFFRRYGMQDAYTVTLNGALLFVVLFYVYPLRFMFDSMFAQFDRDIAASLGVTRMQLHELANASAVYGIGFCVLMILYALLYRHAYARREALGLTPLEAFDARASMTEHLLSAAVGFVAFAFALLAPLRIVFLSPMCFALMGPLHWWWGRRVTRARAALASAAGPAAV